MKGWSDLGLTHVAVELQNVLTKESYNANFLVDTGALHAMAPASVLKRIGIKSMGSKTYELANGERVDFEFGAAQLSFLGEFTFTEILFGPENAEPLLGVLALESAGFLVDPKNQRLTKMRGRPLKAVALKSVA